MAETNLSDLLQTLPGELESFATGAESAAGRAGEFVKQAATLPQRLRQAISDKFEDNKDLITERANALGEYFASGATGREKYQDVFNPFQREALVATGREQAGSKARALTDLLTQRGQRIEDIVGKTSEAFAGEVGAAEIAANAAQSRFANALAIANLKTGLVSEIESQEQREWDKLFNVLQLSGGDIEVDGESYHIPGYEEQLKIRESITGGGKTASQAAEEARKTVQTMAQSGGTLNSVMGAGITMGLGAEETLNIYNSSSIYGPAIESDEDVERRYGIKRGELSKSTSGGDAVTQFLEAWAAAQGGQ